METEKIRDSITRCVELEEFKAILNMLQENRAAWQDVINQIFYDNHYTQTALARLCGVSHTTVKNWLNGSIPSNREDFIRIGFAAHYNLDEMNHFLQRYGKYPALYSKSLEDSVYMFVLNSDECDHTYSTCEEIIKRINDEMKEDTEETDISYATEVIKQKIMNFKSVDQLESFIKENAALYKDAYNKFYKQVIAILVALMNSTGITYAGDPSYNSLADLQGWTASMRQCVSNIRNKKWFPLRRKVIALGIHLNLTVEQIDKLLELAQMEPLCAKNPVESAIIFAVTDADLNDVIVGNKDGDILYEYVYNILNRLNIPDAQLILNDIGGF